MLKIQRIQFGDNFNYLLRTDDPDDIGVVDLANGLALIRELKAKNLYPSHLFLTHHHFDHIDHLSEFIAEFPKVQVYKPADEPLIPVPGVEVDWNSGVYLFGSVPFTVLCTAAHTNHGAAYLFDQKHLFTGDALFEAGCGRLFEGGAAELEEAMDLFASLPGSTELYFGHDYGEVNLRFALSLEPGSEEVIQRLARIRTWSFAREDGPPITLADQFLVNPFLRIDEPSLIQVIDPEMVMGRQERLYKLRQQRNHF